MADYDRRPRGGYRGGRGGGNFRKRRHDDDDFDHRHQRRRFEEPAHIRLRKRLLSLAESSSRKTEDDISELARLVGNNTEDEELTRVFHTILIQLVVEQPLKIPFLAALILAVNSQNSSLVAGALQKAAETLEAHLREGAWREVKLILRLFACLQPLWQGDSVFSLLEELFARAVDLQTASSEDGIGLELVKIILLTTAYAMAAQPTDYEARASALLEKTDIVASTPHVLEALVNPTVTVKEGDSPKSVLGLLQQQMQAESEKGWQLKCIPRPWLPRDSTDIPGAENKHTFPTVTIPATVTSKTRPMLPEIYFTAYSSLEVETVPQTDNSASSLMRDAIVDTINILDFNRNAAARCLIDLEYSFSPGTFAPKGTPFDKLRDTAVEGSTWKPEDVAVDAVFSQLFKLPAPEHKIVYYHSILTEVCKLAPAAIAPSLGRAIRVLYQEIEETDLELNYRFLDWFSHHLSNFGFTWKWTEWVNDIDLPQVHARKSFIGGALEKETRLSFAQRIRGTLPEPYHPLIGEEKEKDTPALKYSDPTTPYSSQGRELVRLLRAKATDAEIEEVLASIQDAAVETGTADPLIQSTDAFITALCFVGSKSISHMLSSIERCKERLEGLSSKSEPVRQQIISSVLAYWTDRPGNGINVIDKLLNYSLLQPSSVLEWVFTNHLQSGEILVQAHIYELVSRTLAKVTNRQRHLVRARLAPDLPMDQAGMLDESISREAEAMKPLFALVEDATRGIADGSADGLVESDERDAQTIATLRQWGQKWRRVFTRKFAIEEAWARETLAAGVAARDAAKQAEENEGQNGAKSPSQVMDTDPTPAAS